MPKRQAMDVIEAEAEVEDYNSTGESAEEAEDDDIEVDGDSAAQYGAKMPPPNTKGQCKKHRARDMASLMVKQMEYKAVKPGRKRNVEGNPHYRSNDGGIFSLEVLRDVLNEHVQKLTPNGMLWTDVKEPRTYTRTINGEVRQIEVKNKNWIMRWSGPALQAIASLLETNLRNVLRGAMVMVSATDKHTLTVRHITDSIKVKGGDSTAHLHADDIKALEQRAALLIKAGEKTTNSQGKTKLRRPSKEAVAAAFPIVSSATIKQRNKVSDRVDVLLRPGVIKALLESVGCVSSSLGVTGSLRRLAYRYLGAMAYKVYNVMQYGKSDKKKKVVVTSAIISAVTGGKVLGCDPHLASKRKAKKDAADDDENPAKKQRTETASKKKSPTQLLEELSGDDEVEEEDEQADE